MLLTWDKLAELIAKMPANARSEPVLSQDPNTGELFGYDGINEPSDGLPHLLDASNEAYEP